MTRPEPGTYIIYNRVEDSEGRRLALTFNGDKKAVTVTPLNQSDSKQHWVIQNYDSNLQHVKPKDNQSLEAGWGETIYTLPVGNYVWGITQDNGYVIKDGERKINWTINSASDGVSVVPVGDPTGEKQRWIFHKADAPLA